MRSRINYKVAHQILNLLGKAQIPKSRTNKDPSNSKDIGEEVFSN